MSAEANDGNFPTVGPDGPDLDGVATVTLENGDLLVYSRSAEDGWIQSDAPVDLATMV